MVETDVERRIAVVRRFNRFYTPLIGLLREGYLESPFSLTAVRVLYELAHRDMATASELARELGLDAGYLSRILRGFSKRSLIAKQRSPTDGRQSLLRLTEHGRAVFTPLSQRSHDQVGVMLSRLPASEQDHLVEAMRTIEALLGDRPEPRVPYLLRPPHSGDMGWVVQRHGALYAREYGWDETFEALVAEVVATFVRQYQPKRERCWIAEREGENVGSVFCVKKSDAVAQLRLLLVEPEVRGLGIGKRLVQECVRFARTVGYRTMMLWTNDVLVTARQIYEQAGFRLVEQEQHRSFGHELVGQNWELEL